MKSETVLVKNKLGLHARVAAQIVRAANKFDSEIHLSNENHNANARGIMGLMMLAATQGTSLNLTVEGEDEETAFFAMKEIFENSFGEDA